MSVDICPRCGEDHLGRCVSTQAKLTAIEAFFARKPDFAVEKALRGEVLTDDEYAKGTVGLPMEAFEVVTGGGYRLTEEALRVAEEVQ